MLAEGEFAPNDNIRYLACLDQLIVWLSICDGRKYVVLERPKKNAYSFGRVYLDTPAVEPAVRQVELV